MSSSPHLRLKRTRAFSLPRGAPARSAVRGFLLLRLPRRLSVLTAARLLRLSVARLAALVAPGAALAWRLGLAGGGAAAEDAGQEAAAALGLLLAALLVLVVPGLAQPALAQSANQNAATSAPTAGLTPEEARRANSALREEMRLRPGDNRRFGWQKYRQPKKPPQSSSPPSCPGSGRASEPRSAR